MHTPRYQLVQLELAEMLRLEGNELRLTKSLFLLILLLDLARNCHLLSVARREESE
jgi:hypothetical protein